ncbi:MAG: YrdB family protein [Gemmatimonadota bacterium]|nr:YrdB family protein [Gemmatimonadota bacterium]MDH5760346.1 YrdB family protein [Gemmatimonadota bacterium]
MGFHPINLGFRFLLELAALVSMAVWGWRTGEGWHRILLAAAVPAAAALLWGVFAVPDDPSRSGGAPVVVPGFVRLIIEAVIFGFGLWALRESGFVRMSAVLGLLVMIHYALSHDRITWLLRR